VVDDDLDREAPPIVVGAVAAGAVPVPFLAVYAVMFIVHGKFHPVVPPDITSTQHGEFVAGIIALVLFVVAFVAVVMMLNGSRRWLFVLVQLAVLGAAIDLIADSTRGGGVVGFALVVTSAIALVLAFFPGASAYVRGRPRRRIRRRADEVTETEPSAAP
jgi:hypothetical protein